MLKRLAKVGSLGSGRSVGTVLSAVLFSGMLLLAGCGGSGSSPTDAGETPPPAEAGGDLDLTKVIFLNPSPLNFPVNAEITSATVSGNRRVTVTFRKPGYTRSGNGKVDGNIWVFGKVNGQWYAGTFEWLLTGATQWSKNLEWEGGQAPFVQVEQKPLSDQFRPQEGETVYFMVSSMTRAGIVPGAQGRSNPFKATWHLQ